MKRRSTAPAHRAADRSSIQFFSDGPRMGSAAAFLAANAPPCAASQPQSAAAQPFGRTRSRGQAVQAKMKVVKLSSEHHTVPSVPTGHRRSSRSNVLAAAMPPPPPRMPKHPRSYSSGMDLETLFKNESWVDLTPYSADTAALSPTSRKRGSHDYHCEEDLEEHLNLQACTAASPPSLCLPLRSARINMCRDATTKSLWILSQAYKLSRTLSSSSPSCPARPGEGDALGEVLQGDMSAAEHKKLLRHLLPPHVRTGPTFQGPFERLLERFFHAILPP